MAAILEAISQTSQTIYGTVHDSTGKLANGAGVEVFNSANWSTYINALTEQGVSGYYLGVFPSYLSPGKYTVVLYAGTGIYGDPVIGSSQAYFDGTIEEQGVGKVLVAYKLDLVAKTAAGATTPTIGSYLDKIMNKSAGQTFDPTTDSLEAITDGGSSGPTAATIAAAVWNELMAGHVTANSAAVELKAIFAALPASGLISNFDPTTATVNLGASQAGVTIGTVNTLASGALASILTQIRTALGTDTMSELANIPSATPTIYQALMIAYMSIRNRHTATGTQEKIYNNAGVAVTTASLTDDGTTYSKEQFT